MTATTTTSIYRPARRAVWRYLAGLSPVVILWVALAGWLAWQLNSRAEWSDEADEATVREWIDHTRPFRKSLPDLVKEYVSLPSNQPDRKQEKREQIQAQLDAMIEPLRTFGNQLPSFPELFSLRVVFSDEEIRWVSPVPRPNHADKKQIRTLDYEPAAGAKIVCEYRLHALNRLQKSEEDRRQTSLVAGLLLGTATLLAALFVWRFIRREHAREIDKFSALADKEHRERDLMEARLLNEETERAAHELHRRAIEAEKAALEVKSQIYASIGIMAGSYAHNIKNLLVRPNDLLARCLEHDGLSGTQETMLHEVKGTLATVTDRLQQILRTVRRDPQRSQFRELDLNAMVKETLAAWHDTALEKWKLHLKAETTSGPLMIDADASHLQQAIENLIFNARDATFEMRNLLREEARDGTEDRKQRILAAAAWKGEVIMTTHRTDAGVVLGVRDNGIGMTDDVKARCLETHFTTKRDNALYEGLNAGMGLGLSFVAMVLEHHKAKLMIRSGPKQGATFEIHFPTKR